MLQETQTLLRDRLADPTSTPQNRKDEAQLHLVLGAGGQRGAYSGGICTAIQAAKAMRVLDKVVVSSTGAYVAAWFLAEQAALGTTMYMEENLSPEFISIKRAPSFFWHKHHQRKAKPVLNLDWVLQKAFVQKGYSYECLSHSPIPLACVATDIETETSVHLDDFSTKEKSLQILQATATVPLWGGDPVSYKGRLLLDGCVLESLPIESAKKLEASHIWAVSNEVKGSLPQDIPDWYRRLVKHFYGESLTQLMLKGLQKRRKTLEKAREAKDILLCENPIFLKVDDKRSQHLWASAKAGFDDACAILGEKHDYPQRWKESPTWI